MKRHPFNLIELMLALGVIVVGLVSVMALFPVGANANRDAMAENYSAEAAEQTLNSIAYYLRSQTTLTGWTNALAKIDAPTGTAQQVTQRIAYQQPIPFTDYKQDCGFLSGGSGTIFTKTSETDYKSGFRIQNCSTGEYNDFEAMMALWQERITVNGTPLLPEFGIVLNLEISWPSQLPYSRRQKARYRLEVFNPNR